jgi:hypothetical protein
MATVVRIYRVNATQQEGFHVRARVDLKLASKNFFYFYFISIFRMNNFKNILDAASLNIGRIVLQSHNAVITFFSKIRSFSLFFLYQT